MARGFAAAVRAPWFVVPAAGVLALGGWFAVDRTLLGDDASAAVAAAGQGEQVVQVGTSTEARTVSATGTVADAQAEDLSFASSGTVTSVDVVAGQEVSAGQVLATIEDDDLQAAVAEAQADLADAQTTLDDDTDAGGTDARLAVDAAQVETATEAVADAQEALSGARLVASFDGTVATVDLTVGEELVAGAGGVSQTGSGSGSGGSAGTLGPTVTGATSTTADAATTGTQISVVSTGTYLVELTFDATDIASVAVGQSASVTPTSAASTQQAGGFGGGAGGFGFPGAATGGQQEDDGTTGTGDADDDGGTDQAPTTSGPAATGTVTEVGATADASSGVAAYPVTVTFTDTGGELLAGTTVQVDVTVAEPEDALTVPAFAVTTADDGSSTVTVRTDDGDETRAVELGESAGAAVVVTSGLSAGEQVVVTAPVRDQAAAGPAGGGAP